MSDRHLPVRPDLGQLKRQAKELLSAVRSHEPGALAQLAALHPHPPDPDTTRLSDAQLVLARAYQASTWPRLVDAVRLANAIWEDDLAVVRELVVRRPALLHEPVLLRPGSSWGPPMSYAANLGRDAIIRFLRSVGAEDLEKALGRAALQGQLGTFEMLYGMAGRPRVPDDALGGPAYTLRADSTAALLALGARVVDEAGRRLAPVDVVLETDARAPEAKHAILELYERHGLSLPHTPPMALHRGRIDLLEEHLHRDPGLLRRTFTHREIYPAEMGCGDPLDATTGTPLDGTTLLHMAIEFDEMEIARWLLERGMDPDAPAAVGHSGFGGWTALFHTVVSQPNYWMNRGRTTRAAPFADLLLGHGADPNVRASLWKRLHPGHGDPARHDYRDVTPLSWGRTFHAPIFVSEPALERIQAAGGVE